MGLVGDVAMRGRGRGSGGEREKREQAESRHVYFYHQSSIFSSAYGIHSLNYRLRPAHL